MLEFNLTNEKLILFSAKAPQVKHMIDYFLTEIKKVRKQLRNMSARLYMVAVLSTLNSFNLRKVAS